MTGGTALNNSKPCCDPVADEEVRDGAESVSHAVARDRINKLCHSTYALCVNACPHTCTMLSMHVCSGMG